MMRLFDLSKQMPVVDRLRAVSGVRISEFVLEFDGINHSCRDDGSGLAVEVIVRSGSGCCRTSAPFLPGA